MLGKLIKYDVKSMNRFLIIIHAFLILASLIIRITLTGHILAPGMDLDDVSSGMSLMLASALYILIFTGVYFATCLIIVIHFYKNLFSDQGYLTRTLPVTSGQHLLSKTISGSIWGCIDMVFLLLSAYIVYATPYVMDNLKNNISQIRTDLGFTGAYEDFSFGALAALTILAMVIGIIGNLIMVYASVAIGQLVSGHRILGAIAAYFVINTVFSFISLIVLVIPDLLRPEMFNSYRPVEHMLSTMRLATILCIVSSAILYITTYWIMDRKINLE